MVSNSDETIIRCLDLFIAGALLLLFGIPLIIVAIALKSESNGSVIFKQERIGRKGNVFTLYKFRSIRISRAGLDLSQEEHAVTRVGEFIRRWRIDEIPQLFNVLKGEMSIVGPRPTMQFQVERYNSEQRRRLDVKPGITGWSQIHGDTAVSWPERIELDLWYLDNRSVCLYVMIVLKTPLALLRIKDVNTTTKPPVDEISERPTSGQE